MKKYLFYIFLLFAPILLTGQVNKSVDIQWSDMIRQMSVKDIEINYYSFPGAANLSQFGALPLYNYEIQLPDELFNCELSFVINSSDTLGLDLSEILSDEDLVKDKIQYHITYSGKKASIFVLPIIKDRLDGRIILIRDIELLIDFVPVEPGIKLPTTVTDYTTKSVLSSGKWFKLGILQTGIHKLGYNDMLEIGIDPSLIDIKTLGIFGNYNGMLKEENSRSRPDDLQENSIYVSGMEDGMFDEEDYILFYACAATKWSYNMFSGRYNHEKNLYADTTFYFLTTDKGSEKHIQTIESVNDEPTQFVNSFFDYNAHENDLVNLIYSGKEWFGEELTGDTLERTFSFSFPDLKKDKSAYIKFEIASRALIDTYFKVYVNDAIVIDSSKLDKVYSSSNIYAENVQEIKTFFADKDELDVKVQYLTDDFSAIAWIDFIQLNVERNLIFRGGQLNFSNPRITAEGNITKFEIEEFAQAQKVWEISDIHNPSNINFDRTEDLLQFTLETSDYRDFVIFDESDFLQPVSTEEIPNQNLHGITNVNYIIISPDIFLEQAGRLAKIHEEIDGFNVRIVTPEQIYNEFSSGSQDISAIRDFMRMLYKTDAFGGSPPYLLMFGDGSYDYKHRVHENTNLVPTYQSKESLRLTGSFVTDDFFGLLDDDEGLNSSGELDVGIGRFPVSTLEQAKTAVDKIEHYLSKDKSVMRNWRNEFCFVADDADKNLHLNQANFLISIADTLNPGININKIFSDAYTRVSVPGGNRYPDANEAIRKQVESGALIMNYTGHGGLISWSDEYILDLPNIQGFQNIDNMPLFITATCEFSRYDDPEFTSAGEYLFLNENGGGIALMTTTRLAYAHANIIVNMRIYNNLGKQEDGSYLKLGDLIRLSKIPSSTNFLNFVLLGDPALSLAFPEYEVVTASINNKIIDEVADTVHALSTVTVSGKVVVDNNLKMSSFNGYMYPKVYDKPSRYKTLGNDPKSYVVDFTLQDKILYNGKVSVKNGEFSFAFKVPQDIAYEYDFGKISYYAVDTVNYVDAWGAFEELYVGGLDETVEQDNTGPEISLYLNDKGFNSGDLVPSNSLLLADIVDEQGINFTGNSLGRDITLTMDDSQTNSTILNEYFKYDLDSYQKGKLSFSFDELDNGWHTLSLKAWDLQNNSSTKSIDFYVDDAAEIFLTEVVNYPNPFTEYTSFGFVHNKSDSEFEVEVKIYDINGNYIGYIKQEVGSQGNSIEPIVWNGRDSNGNMVPGGVYSYHIIVSDIYGNQTIQRQKMIKMHE